MEAKGEAWDGHSWAVTGEKAGWWQILALRWQRTSGQPSPYTGSRTSRPPFQPEKSPAHTLPPRMLGPGLGLPRNVGLPAARSFPGNRQEAWLRVGLPAAGSRVGRAGPWGSEKGGSRKTRDCCCSFSLPQLRSGRGFIQRGKWAASPLHPAYCRSDFCTWLPETKPRPPIFFFFFILWSTSWKCAFASFLFMGSCHLREVCHLPVGWLTVVSHLPYHSLGS